MDIDLDKMARLNKSGFKQCFFYVCERGKMLQIHKMFLKMDIKTRFDSEMLAAGLFAGIMADKPKVIDKVLDIQDKLNVDIEERDLMPVFNLLVKKGDHITIEYLDNKFKFIQKQFENDGYLSIVDNKFYQTSSSNGFGDDNLSPVDKALGNYYGNILSRSLKNENHLTYLLNKDYPVNPTFVEELFLDVCVDKNINSARVLLSHEKTKNIIHNSSELNGYMQESTENKEFKDELRAFINSLDLKDKLEDKLVDKTPSKKVKL